ncbi:hypothetical protein [Aquimarina celericrescens]|uniref:Vitamin K epoxide reductase domain-containing protein n=1 Tax=Aquimarina celericrescens TaxID=1964542 RepID=A0ABW5AZT7_9FLAO|nr:hypothetical protein [Aquimarina celericrescens]
MIKRVLIGIAFFVIGFGVAVFADSFFRKLIQNLFQWTTNNGIQFGGKDFYLFGNPIYFISFGLAFLIFSIANKKKRIQKIVANGVMTILIFGILLIGISALTANLKIIECTACDSGFRRLGYNEISYEMILATSALLSIIPSSIVIFKNWKKASV